VNIWIDESGSNLKFKMKTSSGAMKTVTITFDV